MGMCTNSVPVGRGPHVKGESLAKVADTNPLRL
jgi:hypothetical protein